MSIYIENTSEVISELKRKEEDLIRPIREMVLAERSGASEYSKVKSTGN